MVRVWVFAGLALIAVAFAASFGRGATDADLKIRIEQTGEADLRVIYEWAKPKREIIFISVPGGYRERRWEIATPGFRLMRLETEDRIVREDGAKFDRVELIAKPDLVRLQKEYQPVVRYGEGGALLYTGHFWPVTERGGRVNAAFDFTPEQGADAVAFGERAGSLENWRSPMAHPAFVYLGPLAPVETDEVMALVDPAAPAWIVGEFDALVPRSFAELARLFGFTPTAKPNLFLSAELGGDPGRLSYSGDALPGQFQIALEGGAWREPSEKAKDVFAYSTIHEAVHLWQAAARPGEDDTPEWIHEGAADAIASEVMVALGLWDGARLLAAEEAAETECAAKLSDGSLNGAKARGDYRALYACGHVVASAVARAEGATAAGFWKALILRAQERNGYTADLFYDLVAERTGDPGFADAVEDFARTPLADPRRSIDDLLASAQTLARERGR